MNTVFEPGRQIPIAWEGDLCVLGGSATGVFAAVRAARLGARVCIVERQNYFGGTATAGLVNIWHGLLDFDYRYPVIAGLTREVLDALIRENQCAVTQDRNCANRFNPIAMIRALDQLVREHKITTFFHTQFAGALTDGDRVDCAFIQNKDGRSAIRAKMWIDATGDGDLLKALGVERYAHSTLQPPTTGFLLKGKTSPSVIAWAIHEHGAEFGLDDDWGWFSDVPGMDGITFRADNHVFGLDLSRAADLTEAEFEGRRRAFALEQLLKSYVSPDYAIVNLCSAIGIRETAHYRSRYQITADDLLLGRRFDDAILQGTYRVDIHHNGDNGITFKELDGGMRTEHGKGGRAEIGNWRAEMGLSGDYARFYQMPFEVLKLEKWRNVIPAGRMINADDGAFGALRVMVNLNQTGEAAGVAAVKCLEGGVSVQELDGRAVRQALAAGGSAL